LDTFAQYDAASKRIRDLPTDSPAYAHLQKSVHQAASNFLHLNMLPLKSLPRILKANSKRLPSGLSTMSNSSTLDDNASQADSMASSAYEIEEKQLKEQQMLLEEQKFWVSGMLENARKKRKFDEIGALQQNVEELDAEIEKVKAAIDKLEMGM
jgi:rabenosyn-5